MTQKSEGLETYIEELKHWPPDGEYPPEQLHDIRWFVLGRLKQAEFARILDVSKSTLNRWERGHSTCSGAHARLVWILANFPEVVTALRRLDLSDEVPPSQPLETSEASTTDDEQPSVFDKYRS